MGNDLRKNLSATDNHAPKYVTVYDSLRSDIILNKYSKGSYLPTEFQLSNDYGVSRNTVRHAVQMLADDGLVEVIQGGGIKVLRTGETLRDIDTSVNQFTAEYFIPGAPTVTPPAVDKIDAPEQIAAMFGVPAGTTIYKLQYIWKIDGIPFCYQVQYLNRTLMPGIHKHIDDGLMIEKLAKQHWNLDCNVIEKHISCRNAGFIEANLLGIDLGQALLFTTKYVSCGKGGLEYSEMYHNPEHMGFFLKEL